MFDISPIQIIIVLVIALVVFGPRRLPQMARDMGKGLREFKEGISADASSDTSPSPTPPPRTTPSELPPPAATRDDADDDLDGLVLPGDQQPDTPPRD